MNDYSYKNRDLDLTLDMFLEGKSPSTVAMRMGSTVEAVKNTILLLRRDVKGAASKYVASVGGRASRIGKPWATSETLFYSDLVKAKVPLNVIAALLARKEEELPDHQTAKQTAKQTPEQTHTWDMVLAYRYAFHIYGFRIISDKVYDSLKAEELEFGPSRKLDADPRNVPHHIKTLSLYLTERHEYVTGTKLVSHLKGPRK